ncbi:hypothetical protein GCM10010530_57900 [Kribbella aluminosa]
MPRRGCGWGRLIGTTLAGYTDDTARTDGLALALVATFARELDRPIIAEDCIHTPTQAKSAVGARRPRRRRRHGHSPTPPPAPRGVRTPYAEPEDVTNPNRE